MIVTCAQCGTHNRVPEKHLASRGKCGSCKTEFGPTAAPINIQSGAEFDALLAASRVPLLVDFWAEWCGPCRMVAPEVANAAKQLAGQALVAKVNTETLPQLAARYQVSGIPNFALFVDGKLRAQQAGAMPARQLVAWLRQQAAA